MQLNRNLYRNQFSEIKLEAEVIAKSWGTESQFKSKRKIRTKKFFDELSEDERLHDSEENFKVSLFYANIDNIINQMKTRFIHMSDIMDKFEFLRLSNILNAKDEYIYKSAECLAKQYSDDLSLEFPRQLLSMRNVLRKNITEIKQGSVKDLAELLIITNSILLPSVPDVGIALQLFLTLLITVSSAETLFPKLKIIKNYLRSCIAQERLSALRAFIS